MPEDVEPYVKQEIEKNLVTAKATHDKFLDLRGPVSKVHRCFSVPFDKKLLKKKKFREAKQNPGKKVEKQRDYKPLFEHQPNINLNDNNLFICKNGEVWRTPEMDQKLRSYLLHHGDPYLKLGPFKVEEKSPNPFLILFKDMFSDNEVQHFKTIAENNLKRSSYGNQDVKGVKGIFRNR